MTFRKSINHEEFGRAFLDTYLENGFLALTKKETDLLVLRLLLEHSEDWDVLEPPTSFTLAQELRTKPARIRSLLDDLSFRNSDNEDMVRKKLFNILDKGKKEIDDNKVRIQVEDAYVRGYAKNIVQSNFGIVDTSFDRTIITLSGEKFLLLVAEVMGSKEKKKIDAELEKHQKKFNSGKNKEGLLKIFLQEFVKSAGEEAGKKAIKLGAAALTGGLSEIPDLIESFFGDDNDEAGQVA